MKRNDTLIIVLLAAGLLLIIAAAISGGADLLSDSLNGKNVRCTADVSAPLIGSSLQLSNAACASSSACLASPFRSITSVTGTVGIWYNGVLYDSIDVTEGRMSSPDQYSISACVPKEAKSVTVGIIAPNGGTLNAQSVSIR